MKTLRQLLTQRQFEIAGMVRWGLSNDDISTATGVTVNTVRASLHRSYAHRLRKPDHVGRPLRARKPAGREEASTESRAA